MATRTQSFQNLQARRNPEGMIKEAYASVQEDEPVRYLLGAMEPVEESYTKKTYEEGSRIENQVSTGLAAVGLKADFEYQGSITKNTHIKAYSDIDLLVLEKRFHSLQPPQQPSIPYSGDPIKDLLQIRATCITHLKSAFPKAAVDDSGPRSIKISGGSLVRVVDIVPANWYDTVQYTEKKAKIWRGVHILNAHKLDREADQPFLHGAWIEHKDDATTGSARKLIRLLKSLKYDSEDKVTMSSFDIESLVFRMPDAEMIRPRGEEIPLTAACWLWLKKVEGNQQLRDGLEVPDGKRKIFEAGKATTSQLTALRQELESLLYDVNQGLQRSFRNLAEAKVKWPY